SVPRHFTAYGSLAPSYFQAKPGGRSIHEAHLVEANKQKSPRHATLLQTSEFRHGVAISVDLGSIVIDFLRQLLRVLDGIGLVVDHVGRHDLVAVAQQHQAIDRALEKLVALANHKGTLAQHLKIEQLAAELAQERSVEAQSGKIGIGRARQGLPGRWFRELLAETI